MQRSLQSTLIFDTSRTKSSLPSRMGWKNVNPVIENRLYVGNIIAARSSRSLSERRISHIVSVCEEAIPAELPESGISHLRIPVQDVDYADLLVHFPAACRFIDKALENQGTVLVHCVQGLSRSAAVVAAYLMYARRIHAHQALDLVRRAREQVWPNPGFHEQLVLFELCQYSPKPGCGIYDKWRSNIERYVPKPRHSRTPQQTRQQQRAARLAKKPYSRN